MSEKKEFLGLIEMNDSLKTDVNGGSIFPMLPDILQPCCGLIIVVDFNPVF